MSETKIARQATPPKSATKPKRGRGRPVGDREAQRIKLLSAGIRVIAEEGYADASLRKVAAEAGYSTGAITYYFADKEELVEAIIEHMFDGLDAILKKGVTVTDHRVRLKQWVDLNSKSDEGLAGFQLLVRARHDPKLAAIYRDRYAKYRTHLADLFARQQAKGEVRSDIPAEILADITGSIADGWMIMLPIETDRFSPTRLNQVIDAVIELLQPCAAATPRSTKRTRKAKTAQRIT